MAVKIPKKKEKDQITIRVDNQLMEAARAAIEKDGISFGDLIERAIHLAIKERDHGMSLWERQIRSAANNATREQQKLLRGLLVTMVEPEAAPGALTPEMEKLREFVFWLLKRYNDHPQALECLQRYSLYQRKQPEGAA